MERYKSASFAPKSNPFDTQTSERRLPFPDISEPTKTPFDTFGKRTYGRTCRKLDVTPVTSVGRELDTKAVTLRNRGLGEKDVLAIANALLDNTTVTSLTLDGNNLSEKGLEYICLALAENLNITHLSLRENGLSGNSVVVLETLLLENEVLQSVDVSGNQFTDADASHFSHILMESRHLQELNLSNNSFGDEAAKLLGPAIGSNDTLKVLDLSWNQFRPPGTIHLCKGLEENVSMHTVNLSYNGLANPGAKAVAEALKLNSSLVEIDMTCNRIYDEGAFLIGKALEVNESLKVIKMSQNPLTDLGALALLYGVQKNLNSLICYIDMTSVHIYHRTVAISRELNQRRAGFCFLYGQIMDETLIVKEGMDSEESPLLLLQWYMDLKQINLFNVFKDKVRSGLVTAGELKEGLQSIKAPLTDSQIDRLIEQTPKPISAGSEDLVDLEAIIYAPRIKEKTVIPKD